MKARRVFLTVLDSLGIGASPDAREYGDEGANTLATLVNRGNLSIPNLLCLGLGNIDGVDCLDAVREPLASHCRLIEKSVGKDTTVGHFELMGIVTETPFPTFAGGFPVELVAAFEDAAGIGTLCGMPYSGTEVIRDFGKEHLESGRLIIYTSADSVFQIAAHESIVPPERLYEYCAIARRLLVGKWGVGRVIARPFTTAADGSFVRTERRRDFSLPPPKKCALHFLKENRLDVISVGKIYDIFAGEGITEAHKTKNNAEGIRKTTELMRRDFSGLCFTNLVDFDMLFGHRQDIPGYVAALSEYDAALPEMLSLLREDDVLVITADHGCDPGDDSTDHTRECVPLLIYSKGLGAKSLGTVRGFDSVGALVCELLGVAHSISGVPSIFDMLN